MITVIISLVILCHYNYYYENVILIFGIALKTCTSQTIKIIGPNLKLKYDP